MQPNWLRRGGGKNKSPLGAKRWGACGWRRRGRAQWKQELGASPEERCLGAAIAEAQDSGSRWLGCSAGCGEPRQRDRAQQVNRRWFSGSAAPDSVDHGSAAPDFIQFGLGEGRYPLSNKQGSCLFHGRLANLVDIPPCRIASARPGECLRSWF
jgi:hypothetical protein